MSEGRGYLELLEGPFYEVSDGFSDGAIWWVLTPYKNDLHILIPTPDGKAFAYRPLKPEDMFKSNLDLQLYRYYKIRPEEKPLVIRFKVRPCIILEPYFKYDPPVFSGIKGPIKHLRKKPYWAIPIYSLATSDEDLTHIPRAFKTLSLYFQVSHLFYCPCPPNEIIAGEPGLRNLHKLEGIARIDRMFITFELPTLVRTTRLKLSSSALSILKYLIAEFMNIELPPKEKELVETIKTLVQEEFEKHSLQQKVLKVLGVASQGR